MPHSFRFNNTPGAASRQTSGGWRLSIPAGWSGVYRLAQLDDYHGQPRRAFPHQPPLRLRLRARASAASLPGTWGFGLWNDPFSFSLGLGGGRRALPALPNAAWFFFASAENHLAFRDDLPGHGPQAAVYCAPRLPGWALAPAALGLPLLLVRPVARLARRIAARVIRQAASALAHDPTGWHGYEIHWRQNAVSFRVDGALVLETALVPQGPLGLVLWLDNQYAAWRPDGRPGYGFLENPAAWIELSDIALETLKD